MTKKLFPKVLIGVLLMSATVFAQRDLGARPTDSGGVLMPEQAAYDVISYDLAVRPNIVAQTIKGVLTIKASIVKTLDEFVLDLDYPFTVESVELLHTKEDRPDEPLKFERRKGKIWISFRRTVKAGEAVEVRVAYSGKPKIAPKPPWVGGFVWSKTADGSPWFATAVQNDGADLWFPVKDHPSDKPETTTLHFTVPQNLVTASNGKLKSIVKNSDGTHTYNWFVSQPISNYNIALNVAPYKLIEDKMLSITGETIPIAFYVLPEHFGKGQDLINKTKDYVKFYEEYLGPYPFRADKLGIAETPHLGMEHQSITAYGNEFKYDADGVDTLMFHELGHEWWANLVTAADWKDFWIHEGFQSFMDALYKEKLQGSRDSFVKSLPGRIKSTKNVKPVAPRQARTTVEMYLLPPDYTKSDGDIYGKGALVLNTLRYYIGDEAFFKSLRRMAYPTTAMEKITNGKQTRLVTTDDFLRIAERESGKNLDWFFEIYLRQLQLPKLIAETNANQLILRWDVPKITPPKLKPYEFALQFFNVGIGESLPFPMPVEVEIGGAIVKVEMKNGFGAIPLPANAKYTVDPRGWLLKAL